MNKEDAEWVVIRGKYKTKCHRCYGNIYPNQLIEWRPETKKVRHTDCKSRLKVPRMKKVSNFNSVKK